MSDFIEDQAERRMFDDSVARIFDGSPLRAIAAGLTIQAKMAPEVGSHGKTLKIWANEVARAASAVAGRDAEVARLREALIGFLNAAPQAGDYRLALLACKGFVLEDREIDVAKAYSAARDKARAALSDAAP